MLPPGLTATVPCSGCNKPVVVIEEVLIEHKNPMSLPCTSMIMGVFGCVTTSSSTALIRWFKHFGCRMVPTSMLGEAASAVLASSPHTAANGVPSQVKMAVPL